MNDATPNIYMSRKQYAEKHNVSLRTVDYWLPIFIKNNLAYHLGNIIRIHWEAADKFLLSDPEELREGRKTASKKIDAIPPSNDNREKKVSSE